MKKVIFCVCMTAFLFGTMETALKLGGSELDSLQLTFLRFFIGGLLLVPFAVKEAKSNEVHLTVRDIGWLAVVGLTGIGISMVCFQYGVDASNASTAAPLFCINPLFTMVIAHLFTNEKMDKIKMIAMAIGLVAIVFMIRPWDLQAGNSVIGMVLMLVAAVTFAAYTVMGKRSIARIGTFLQTSVSFIIGALMILVVILATGRPVIEGISENWKIVAYVSVMVTGLGYFFYFTAIKHSDATTGSIAFFIKPAIAPVFAVVLLGETVMWNTVIGIVLLIIASFLTIYDSKYKQTRIFEEKSRRGRKRDFDVKDLDLSEYEKNDDKDS